jgi:general secretion pathway protein D
MYLNINQGIYVGLQKRLLICLLLFCICGCIPANLRKHDNSSKELVSASKATEVPARIAALDDHDKKIEDFLRQAQAAWDTEDLGQLDSIYKALGQYDMGNYRAEEGLRMVSMAKNHVKLMDDAKKLAIDGNDALAIERLHEILLERPEHPLARPMYEALRKKQEVLAREKTRKKLSYKNPISMEFRDVSIKGIFEALSKTTNINFILDKDISSEQKATIFVKNVSFSDALDLLLQTNQLEKKVLSETSVIIYPNDPNRQREYKDLTVRSFSLNYADPKQISTTLRSMLGVKQMEVDTRLSTITIKDSLEMLALVEKLIVSQDIPDPEVMLELEVLEVKRSNLQNLGVDLPSSITLSGSKDGMTLRDLTSVNRDNLKIGGGVGLTFEASSGDVDLLANPKIRVRNKDTAKIHIGEKVPVFTSNASSNGVISQTVQYIDAGLKLEVEPTISSSGDVSIKLNLNVASIGEPVTSGGSSAFRVGTRSTSTQLRLHDGETQILAGLIDDQDRKNISKVPGIGDFPLLGRLFSRQKDDKSKTEIVLSITPRIVREFKSKPANQTEYWIGSEGATGRHAPSPNFSAGVPFFIPKPAPAAVKTEAKEDKPQSLNVPLPPGLSLGGGLSPKSE